MPDDTNTPEPLPSPPRPPKRERGPGGEGRHPNWGGRRKGAGAPKGNLNAYRHGRYSKFQQALTNALGDIPGAEKALVSIGRRSRRRKKLAESGSTLLMQEIFERIGEIMVNPENNHVEDNQDLLTRIRVLEAYLTEMQKYQSK